MKHSRKNRAWLTASLLVVGGALADQRAEASPITELADGTLVAYRQSPGAPTAVHYVHQSKLVATRCAKLEVRRRTANRARLVSTT